jgi:hypothetical protein
MPCRPPLIGVELSDDERAMLTAQVLQLANRVRELEARLGCIVDELTHPSDASDVPGRPGARRSGTDASRSR